MAKNTPHLTILKRLDKVLPSQSSAPEKALLASALGEGIDLGELGILRWVDVGRTRESAWQTRDGYDDAHIESIGESLDGQGLIEVPPARFWPEDPSLIEIGAGHCRTEAVRRGHNAGSNLPDPDRFKGKMLFWIRARTDLEMAAIAVDENAARENPNLMEQAKGYKNLHAELKNAGLVDDAAPWDVIAERAKVSTRRVMQIAALLKLPLEAQKKIAAKFWNEKHGRAILDTAPENQAILMGQIERRGLSGNQAVVAAAELRKTHPTQRDLDLGVTIAKAVKTTKKTRAKIAAQENQAAVAAGTSPLQLIAGGQSTSAPAALDGTQETQKMAAEVASSGSASNAPKSAHDSMSEARNALRRAHEILRAIEIQEVVSGERYALDFLESAKRDVVSEVGRIKNQIVKAENAKNVASEVSSN